MKGETEEEETTETEEEETTEEKDQEDTEMMMEERNSLLLLEIWDIEHLREQSKNFSVIAGMFKMLELRNKMERVKDFATLILKAEKLWIRLLKLNKELSLMEEQSKLMKVTREEVAAETEVEIEEAEEIEEVSEEKETDTEVEEIEEMMIKYRKEINIFN